MNKNELRKIYKSKRQVLSQSEVMEASIKIAEQVNSKINFADKTVSLFFSIESHKEIDTKPLFDLLKSNNCIITGSVSNFNNNTLVHKTVSNYSNLKVNKFGIPEPLEGTEISPKNFDIVFVPLLACDIKGKRVGYGKGFYDRFLAQCHSNCQFIGLNFFEPIEKISDSNQFDIPLHSLITPKLIHHF